jgi:hypothetical protein
MHQSVYRRFEAGEVLIYDRLRDYRPSNLKCHVDFSYYYAPNSGAPPQPQCVADDIELKWESRKQANPAPES